MHGALAVSSLLQENPTVDEVAHLPAGVSYWETGTFKLYHHNPPLVKLVAALPVVLSTHVTAPLYQMGSWRNESQATFAMSFAFLNQANYFELFDRARLLMPLFSILGGLVVFEWSRRLYGSGGGLLSLALWCLCPNVLAHSRLVTSDLAGASIGAGATYLFWRSRRDPRWSWVVLAGVALGLAQLTKFSLILLYGLWPLLAIVRFLLVRGEGGSTRWSKVLARWVAILGLSLLVIDAGYLFEGVGTPLGKLEFASRSLTSPAEPGSYRPTNSNQLLTRAWSFRVNRFRGTLLGPFPSPLPRHFLLGFDEQKLESEGVPFYFSNPSLPHDDSKGDGYPVYLNGQLRRTGWWYYYLATLAYKIPEGTWALVLISGGVLVGVKRSKAAWADELTVLAIPVVVLLAMSFLTDICLGLRYILAVFPFVFIATGKVVPWATALAGWSRKLAVGAVAGSIVATTAATLTIHPDYLAYFNQVSGGPDRGSEHLIDSNLDWGQDLLKLNRWLKKEHPGRKVGLAYFGQINPTLLTLRRDGFRWFLPPVLPGTTLPVESENKTPPIGPLARLEPGLYAVSASLVRGLPFRLHDPRSLDEPVLFWEPRWNAREGAFAYFRELRPVHRVGRSIYVYEVTQQECDRLAPLWAGPRVGK